MLCDQPSAPINEAALVRDCLNNHKAGVAVREAESSGWNSKERFALHTTEICSAKDEGGQALAGHSL